MQFIRSTDTFNRNIAVSNCKRAHIGLHCKSSARTSPQQIPTNHMPWQYAHRELHRTLNPTAGWRKSRSNKNTFYTISALQLPDFSPIQCKCKYSMEKKFGALHWFRCFVRLHIDSNFDKNLKHRVQCCLWLVTIESWCMCIRREKKPQCKYVAIHSHYERIAARGTF